jgi:uncharacterized membrane protein
MRGMRPRPWLIVVLAGAFFGLVFAGVSTWDFVQHLDRQTHSVHCSFVPGMGLEAGGSGCQAAMMSSYSSVFRTAVWGGIPISLPAMSVFAFLLFFAIDLALSGRQEDRRATGFLALATALPVAASIVMALISITELGTVCKLCVGIYLASAACATGAILLWRRASRSPQRVVAVAAPVARGARPEPRGRGDDDPAFTRRAGAAEPPEPAPPVVPPPTRVRSAVAATSSQFLLGAFAVGVLFVIAPVLLYAAVAPDHDRFIGTCDGLAHPEDPYGIMVRLGPASVGAAPAIEILDPLCPSCRAFEERLEGSGMAELLDRRAVLFPLDSTCNWMVTESMHPGACAVSEAVLCAGDKAGEVIAWSFANQEQVRAATAKDPAAAARMVGERFPALASCVGSPTAKSKLNKSLRWAVSNNLTVLTPQLFVDGVKLCDEDVDLGLEYALGGMLERRAQGRLKVVGDGAATAAVPPPPPPVEGAVAADPAAAPPAAAPAASPPGAAPVPAPSGTADRAPADTASGSPSRPQGSGSGAAPATEPGADRPASSPSDVDPAATPPAAPAPAPAEPPAPTPPAPEPAPAPADEPAPSEQPTPSPGGNP